MNTFGLTFLLSKFKTIKDIHGKTAKNVKQYFTILWESKYFLSRFRWLKQVGFRLYFQFHTETALISIWTTKSLLVIIIFRYLEFTSWRFVTLSAFYCFANYILLFQCPSCCCRCFNCWCCHYHIHSFFGNVVLKENKFIHQKNVVLVIKIIHT